MKHPLASLLIIIGLFILNVSIFSFYQVFNTKPDILLIIVITAGLFSGSKSGILFGFIAGSLQDLFLGGMLGVFTVAKMVIGGVSGLVEGKFFKENFILPPITIFVFTIIHELFIILLSKEIIFNMSFFQTFLMTVLPEAIYNTALGLLLYLLFYKLNWVGEI